MGFWAAAAPALISAGGAILGGLLGRNKGSSAPNPPDYTWIKQYGPEMWNKLRDISYRDIDNPYGIPEEIKSKMLENQRLSRTAGYGAATNQIAQNTALSGLNPTGGTATRQQYYAGQQLSEGLGQAYSSVDIADWQAKEEQRNRGYNMLFALSNKNPVYSQIAAQNYWNSVNANQQYQQLIGGIAGNTMSYYLMNQYNQQQNPQANSSQMYNPYLTQSGQWDPTFSNTTMSGD